MDKDSPFRRVIRVFGNAYVTNIENAKRIAAALKTADFVERRLRHAKRFGSRQDLLFYGLERAKPGGLILEFGVYRGRSLRWLAKKSRTLGLGTVYGFDSFEGLPERWREGFPKSSFRLREIPTVPRNTEVIPGRFEVSLPRFLSEHTNPISFIHMDADLYSSTAFVLREVAKAGRIQPGVVIQFDEFFNYADWWEGGEYRAFSEFETELGQQFEFLGYVGDGEQVCVRAVGDQVTPASKSR